MREIKLTQGKFAIVDDEDFEWLSKYRWCSGKSGSTYYAVRAYKENGKCKTIFMHREIMKTPTGIETDHKNGDGLDNRRENLRIATHAENGHNRKRQKNNTSGYKGVSWNKCYKKWVTSIRVNGKSIYLGAFNSKQNACETYATACLCLHGKFANN